MPNSGDYNFGGAFGGMLNGEQQRQNDKGKNTSKNQKEAQTAAHPNSSGPNGSNTWTQNPDGSWANSTSFGGPLGGLNDSVQQQAADAWKTPLGNGDQARDQAINAAYSQATSRLNPQWDQNSAQLEAKLAAQGLDPNSQAYRTAMQNLSQQKNDAYSSAMNMAIGQGTAAQQATFGENLAARNAPLQYLQGMQGLLPGQAGDQGLNALQVAYGHTDSANANASDAIAGGAKAGASVFAASDERLKDDIQPLPFEATDGVPFSTFRYKNDPSGQQYMGVIAQQLEQAKPEHVFETPEGVKAVSPDFAPVPIGPDVTDALASVSGVADDSANSHDAAYLSNEGKARSAIQRQLEQAKALKSTNYAAGHRTAIGAALGGIGDIASALQGKSLSDRATADESSLNANVQKTVQRQIAEELAARRKEDERMRGGGGGYFSPYVPGIVDQGDN